MIFLNVLLHLKVLSWLYLIITAIAIWASSRKINWEKNNRRFVVKKAIDSMVYISQFIFPVYGNYFITSLEVHSAIIFIPVIGSIINSLFALYLFTQQFIMFNKVDRPFNVKVFPAILISLLIGILMSFSTINYVIYIIWPSFYDVPSNMSFLEIAFEFIYYSFTLAVTYSSSSISVIHVFTKIIQMIEICYCYIIFGSVFIQLVDKFGNNANTESMVN